MICDHATTRASFAAFFGATKLIGGQDLGGGQWLLLGTCVGCSTTLAIQIAEPRGNAVRGEIDQPPPVRWPAHATGTPTIVPERDAPPPVRPFAGRHARDIDETAEEHARRVIK